MSKVQPYCHHMRLKPCFLNISQSLFLQIIRVQKCTTADLAVYACVCVRMHVCLCITTYPYIYVHRGLCV